MTGLKEAKSEISTYIANVEAGLSHDEAENGTQNPMAPAVALARFGRQMSTFEQKEVLEYPEVYFVGTQANKVQPDMNGDDEAAVNFGYDDNEQHLIVPTGDHIAYRYKYVRMAGSGTFGRALECVDCKTGEEVVVKVVRNETQCNHQSDIETRTLETIQYNDPDGFFPLVQLREKFVFRSHQCLVFEKLDRSIAEVLESPRGRAGLPMDVVRSLAKTAFKALGFLHSVGVIHCDIKPENLLLEKADASRTKACLKVIDFNTSSTTEADFFLYIQTRFYRSPEVILGAYYGTAIDVWSMGCTLVEMITGEPLFPGEDESDMLACIMEVCGPPAPALFDSATQTANYFDETGNFCGSKRNRRAIGSVPLASMIGCDDAVLLDLIWRCLQWDPKKRITVPPSHQASRSRFKVFLISLIMMYFAYDCFACNTNYFLYS